MVSALMKASCPLEGLEDALRNTEALLMVIATSLGPDFGWLIWIPCASTLTASISTLSMELDRAVVRAVMALVEFVYFAEDASGTVSSSARWHVRRSSNSIRTQPASAAIYTGGVKIRIILLGTPSDPRCFYVSDNALQYRERGKDPSNG